VLPPEVNQELLPPRTQDPSVLKTDSEKASLCPGVPGPSPCRQRARATGSSRPSLLVLQDRDLLSPIISACPAIHGNKENIDMAAHELQLLEAFCQGRERLRRGHASCEAGHPQQAVQGRTGCRAGGGERGWVAAAGQRQKPCHQASTGPQPAPSGVSLLSSPGHHRGHHQSPERLKSR